MSRSTHDDDAPNPVALWLQATTTRMKTDPAFITVLDEAEEPHQSAPLEPVPLVKKDFDEHKFLSLVEAVGDSQVEQAAEWFIRKHLNPSAAVSAHLADIPQMGLYQFLQGDHARLLRCSEIIRAYLKN